MKSESSRTGAIFGPEELLNYNTRGKNNIAAVVRNDWNTDKEGGRERNTTGAALADMRESDDATETVNVRARCTK